MELRSFSALLGRGLRLYEISIKALEGSPLRLLKPSHDDYQLRNNGFCLLILAVLQRRRQGISDVVFDGIG